MAAPAFGELYYRHSGRFTSSGAAAGLAVGLAAGVALAAAYAYLLIWVPWAALRMMLPIGFGAALGVVPALVMKRQLVRNTLVAMAVGGVASVVGFYFAWAVWMYALFHQAGADIGFVGLLGLVFQPQVAWNIVRAIGQEGAWALKSSGQTVKGWQLWLVWASEAVAVLGFAVLAARYHIAKDPFCETCHAWCKETKGVAWVGPVEKSELKRHLEGKHFGFFETHAVPADEAPAYRLDLHSCATCDQTHTLSARYITRRRNGQKDEKLVVDKLRLSSSEAHSLRAISAGRNFPAAA
jgi:hypothetical protein